MMTSHHAALIGQRPRRSWNSRVHLPVSLLDLFCNLLFLFMLYTVLAFSSLAEAPERTLPPVDLAQGDAQAKPGVTAVSPATITVSQKEGKIRYFLDGSEVPLQELPQRFAELRPREVVLRIHEDLPHKVAIGLMAILARQGVSSISFAYKVPPKP